jgi:hypothetical protein
MPTPSFYSIKEQATIHGLHTWAMFPPIFGFLEGIEMLLTSTDKNSPANRHITVW